MTHIAVFSIFVIAVAVSVAYAGVIPPGLPDPELIPTPNSKDAAIDSIERGTSIGKKGINIRITAFIAETKRDDSLPPACKECIVKKANDIRENTLGGIEVTGAAIKNDIEESTDDWEPVWQSFIKDLPNTVWEILTETRESLDSAKADCVAQTATPEAA